MTLQTSPGVAAEASTPIGSRSDAVLTAPSPRRVRLAIIAGQLGLGGAEQQLHYLLSALDRSRFEPSVITLGHAAEYWGPHIRSLDIPVYQISRRLGQPGRLAEVSRLLHLIRPHVVHSWSFHTNPYAAVAGLLVGARVRIGSLRESVAGLPRGRLLRFAGSTGLHVVITNSAANLAAGGRLNARVRVVPNGIELPDPAAAADRAALKRELGCSPDETVVGAIGRLDGNKNHVVLLRAFGMIAARNPELRLVIIGDGPLRQRLGAEAADLGLADRLLLTGPLPRAARLLPAFDVCCSTSLTEGMPNVLMEASAAGVAVVATPAGGTVDVVRDTVTGFLVPLGNDTALASRIEALVRNSDLRLQMGAAGRERMRREFSVPRMTAQMAALYEEHLTGPALNRSSPAH